jgi:HSP20 family protein
VAVEVVEAEELDLYVLSGNGCGRKGKRCEQDKESEPDRAHPRTVPDFVLVLSSTIVASSRDLFANFERMRREIDELFGDVFERQTGLRGRGFSPSVDVFYADEPPRAVVKADLAGVDIQDVALEIRGRQLVIAGERRPAESAGRLYQQIEIEHGPFRRVVELGAEVVAGEARASYEDGILEVEIPLARPDDAVRRVPIHEREA